ncbi:hypothetical protein CSC70_00900 [Pseudoxanthomonas kalamensis DSM 18571]|uniref:VanZ family protein n=1 Tax=Pseudoxanthomonas kalamensis TaxID=289483 RepID=UPI001391155A|nr:VanZ family protein [Pseudoxanthomonas kalamensis]KAF1712122.1 hypothetical protein CSC70_00900 [Pseudoxanthomonas kalamensis DSM 18571]
MRALKPLRRRGLWLGLWLLAVATVIWVCLAPRPPLEVPLPENGDKLEHLLAYFVLMAGAVQLFATRRALLWVAVGLFLLGIGIEWAQGAWTSTRSADVWDAVADTLGIGLGLATALTPWRDLLLRWAGRTR